MFPLIRSRSGVLLPTIALIFLIPLACNASTETGQPPDRGVPLPLIKTPPPLVESYQVYFTDPDSPSSQSYHGGPDEALTEAIHQARLSVDIAAYDFNLWNVREALIYAHWRGVAVRLVTDSDNLEEDDIRELSEAGIPVLGDRREGLMHNKFVVIDRQEVWSGSMNLTIASAYRHNNNLVRIRSLKLAQDYTTEFEEMFVNDQFGPGSPANTPYPIVAIGGMEVEAYFSPEDGVADRLLKLIDQAQHSLYFMAYSFTSDELAQALLERARSGVRVVGVFDESQYNSNAGSEYDNLLSAGLDVRLDGNPDLMHHKVIIIDEQVVITGSYNFSFNAENKNDENVLILHNPAVAALFQAEFERVLGEAH